MSKRFQQTNFWCDFKSAHGWKKISQDGINILVRSFGRAPLRFSIAYVPLAPEYPENKNYMEDSQNVLQDECEYLAKVGEFSKKIKSVLPKGTLCVRYDLPLDFDTVEKRDAFIKDFKEKREFKESFSKNKFTILKNKVDIQPPDSTYLELSKSEDDLLSSMKSKWRYNVRYASKHEVKVRAVHAGDENFEKDLNSFYSLYKTTAERDGIGMHSISYYKDLMERSDEKSKVTLYIASHEGQDLAAIVTLFQEDEAIYLYGCSGNEKRNLMPAYLVQWTAICDAKKFGSKIYDFYGIPPTGDENHPMHGLYLFKTGFGGKEVHRPGSFDIPLSPLYKLYTCAENLRAWYHKIFLKKIRGR
ncbi:lipid II:glycine glycyltransferase FemX [Treponema zioleckii]|uniref:lipid II:glycine glycyltransferase FemX n=1 Tax=Treponema zioleckii TaxID=331680 RepID=UPI00168A86D0|nr:peptidoglycan bridge formation glycyltransferase FemA/FemB family protein [Treponema zioleckii]